MAGTIFVPIYASATPKVGDFPFFYFYLYMPAVGIVLRIVSILRRRLRDSSLRDSSLRDSSLRDTEPQLDGLFIPTTGQSRLAFGTLSLGSALALFVYPHTITGSLAAKRRGVINRNMSLLPVIQ